MAATSPSSPPTLSKTSTTTTAPTTAGTASSFSSSSSSSSSTTTSTAATPQSSATALYMVDGQRSYNLTTLIYDDDYCSKNRSSLTNYQRCCTSSGHCGNYGFSYCNGTCLWQSNSHNFIGFDHYQCSQNMSLPFGDAKSDPCTTFDNPPARKLNASFTVSNLQQPAAAYKCQFGWLSGDCSGYDGLFVSPDTIVSDTFCQRDLSDSVLYASRSYGNHEQSYWIDSLPTAMVCDGRPYCASADTVVDTVYACTCSQTADESAIAACTKPRTSELIAILVPTLFTLAVFIVCVVMYKRVRELLNRWFSGRAAKEAAEAYKQRRQEENFELQRRNEQADREAEEERQRALDIEARDQRRREEIALQAKVVALENERRRVQIEQERRAIGHDREDLELSRQEEEIEHNGRLRIGVHQLAHLERQTLALSDRHLQFDFDVGVDPTTGRAVNRSAMIMQSTGRSTSDAEGVADMLNASANRRALPATQQPPRSSRNRS
ncbi:hypothetical protein DFJ73DRAFT_798945 [Zopfochytrium polystomum]|nr:hypothetical protein DFJ73DRAFT_798945 [Zopfochytrium polystomum]